MFFRRRKNKGRDTAHSKQVVFVSLGDDVRYNRHLVSILGLPDGFIYKFRYLKSWLHSSFLQEPSIEGGRIKRWFRDHVHFNRYLRKISPRSLSGAPGIFTVIMRNPGKGDRLIPIREFQVFRAFDYGNVAFFEVELGRLVDFKADEQKLAEDLRKATYGESTYDQMQKEIFVVSPPINIPLHSGKHRDERRRAWAHIIDVLAENKVLPKLSCLLISFRELGSPGYLSAEKLNKEHTGLRLQPGKSYMVEIFQYRSVIPTQPILDPQGEQIQAFIDSLTGSVQVPEPGLVSLECDESVIQVVKGDEVIDGDFDRFGLVFRISGRSLTESTILRIRDSQQVSGVQMPIIEMNLAIKNSLLRRFANHFALLAGIVGFVIPSVLQSLSGRLVGFLIPDSVLYRLPKYGPLADNTVQALSVIGLLMVLANWSLSGFVQELKSTLKMR